MNNITIMTDDLANKIAAGEVIEKTYNVVKELLENAIDAEASEITISLVASGIKEIIVRDNGKGMSKADALLAFKRHASSKLKRLDDLFSIDSLGFRGEALPSIAAVSKVKLITSDGKEGTEIDLLNSEIISQKKAPLDKGTSVIVSELFYNTPVRLKFLKNEYAELASISEYVSKMALSYPDIRFVLTNNGKELINTDGSGNLLKTISKIYSVETVKKMLEIDAENDDYKITGYITYPEITKSNRNHINLFVNGRYIKNNELNKYILKAYHTYLPIDKYPIVVINIEVDPRLVDVNIHPNKLDIKFSKTEELKELLIKTISNKLLSINLMPEIEQLVVAEEEDIYIPEDAQEQIIFEEEKELETDEISLRFEEDPMREDISRIYPVALVHGTYIIAENEEGMFMIDQHAAAERINYEKYLEELAKDNPNRQMLLVPIKVELAVDEFILLNKNKDIFENLGFISEDFGINTILIREHPVWLKEEYLKSAIDKIIEIIIKEESFDKAKFIEKIAINLACKMSVKANDHMTQENMQDLVDRLLNTKNPFTCPHGRPTIIKYSRYEIEKMFKRAMN